MLYRIMRKYVEKITDNHILKLTRPATGTNPLVIILIPSLTRSFNCVDNL